MYFFIKKHALGIGRCYKNLEYTWIIAEQTDVSDLSAINHVIRTRVRTHFRRVQIWYCATMRNL